MSDLIENLNWRYATKIFDSSRVVSEKDVEELLEVLRLSPSSFGLQPWKFIVVESKELREKLMRAAWNQSQVVDASHLFVLARKSEITDGDIERFMNAIVDLRQVTKESLSGYHDVIRGFLHGRDVREKEAWMKDQVYIALGFLLAACAEKRIDSCPMEGFDSAKADAILGLEPLGLKSVVLCPIGYRSSEDSYAFKPKVRYGTDDVVLRL
jgi:nitroreductase